MSLSRRREGVFSNMFHLVAGGMAAALLALAASSTWGTGWMAQPIEIPVGWLVVGALVLTFVPTLSLVAVVQRRLGVSVEIEDA